MIKFITIRIFCISLFIVIGNSSALANTSFKIPDEKFIEEVCIFVSKFSEYGEEIGGMSYVIGNKVPDLTQVSGYIDVNNDNYDEKVYLLMGGTSHSTGNSIIDEKSGKELEVKPAEIFYEDWRWMGWGGGDIRWLKFKNKTFMISGVAKNKPTALWYINPNNEAYRVCRFKNKNKLSYSFPRPTKYLERSNVKNICDKVGKNKITTYYENLKSNKKAFSLRRESGGGTYYIDVDIDNDGKKEIIYAAHYSSGSGAGCERDFYIIDGHQDYIIQQGLFVKGGPSRDKKYDIAETYEKFYRAQELGDCSGRFKPKFFSHSGHDFLEIKMPDNHAIDHKHEVWLFKDGTANNICKFSYKNVISIY